MSLPGRYWPEKMDRYHPYGRGYGRGRVQLQDMPPGRVKQSSSSQAFGFREDRSSSQQSNRSSYNSSQSDSEQIPFIAPEAQRLTREYVIFAHHLPAHLDERSLRDAVNKQLVPYGNIRFTRNNSRTSIRINLVNHISKPDFDPSAKSCQSLLLDRITYRYSSVFMDIRKRLLQSETVDVKLIESHIVLANSFEQQISILREKVSLSSEFSLITKNNPVHVCRHY